MKWKALDYCTYLCKGIGTVHSKDEELKFPLKAQNLPKSRVKFLVGRVF